jgi:hypothetical protein
MAIVGGISLGNLLLLYRNARKIPAVPVALEGLITLAPPPELVPETVPVVIDGTPG